MSECNCPKYRCISYVFLTYFAGILLLVGFCWKQETETDPKQYIWTLTFSVVHLLSASCVASLFWHYHPHGRVPKGEEECFLYPREIVTLLVSSLQLVVIFLLFTLSFTWTFTPLLILLLVWTGLLGVVVFMIVMMSLFTFFDWMCLDSYCSNLMEERERKRGSEVLVQA